MDDTGEAIKQDIMDNVDRGWNALVAKQPDLLGSLPPPLYDLLKLAYQTGFIEGSYYELKVSLNEVSKDA